MVVSALKSKDLNTFPFNQAHVRSTCSCIKIAVDVKFESDSGTDSVMLLALLAILKM